MTRVKVHTYILLLIFIQFSVGESDDSGNPSSSSSDFNAEDYDPDEGHCVYDPNRLFYQNRETGTICCRGKVLPMFNSIAPEVSGECAISTKTRSNGTLDSSKLWCAYTCRLKKLGLIDGQGLINPEKFHDLLSKGISASSKAKLKTVMEKHLKCWKPLKNAKFPCYTPLVFHKCWKDAVEFLCTSGMPKNNDFSSLPKQTFNYANMIPACYYDDHRSMPACCHGRPMPWQVIDIVASETKPELVNACLDKIGNISNSCMYTCYMNALGVVDNSMEINVTTFENQIMKYFPFVKASMWMNMLGPTFVFYAEYMSNLLGEKQDSQDMVHRVCQFQQDVFNIHISKIEDYCEMTSEELQQANAESSSAA